MNNDPVRIDAKTALELSLNGSAVKEEQRVMELERLKNAVYRAIEKAAASGRSSILTRLCGVEEVKEDLESRGYAVEEDDGYLTISWGATPEQSTAPPELIEWRNFIRRYAVEEDDGYLTISWGATPEQSTIPPELIEWRNFIRGYRSLMKDYIGTKQTQFRASVGQLELRYTSLLSQQIGWDVDKMYDFYNGRHHD